MSEGRTCAACGEPLVQRPEENNWNFQKRKSCGKECARILTGRGNAKPRIAEVRLCEICGDPIPHNGEPLWRFRQRQRCDDPQCAHNHMAITSPPLDEKSCVGCGVIMQRGEQALARFKARKYCTYECSAQHKGKGVPAKKACIVCSSPMERRPNETASQWRSRATCSGECRYRLTASKGAKARTPKSAPPKTCVVCGKVFAKRKSESHSTFAVKKACDRICAAVLISEARSIDWQPKPCEWCGDMFSKREDELGKQFSRRRCCSDRCRIELMLKTRLNGEPIRRRYPRKWNAALKRLVRERDGFACRECGVIEDGRAHHVHHIDYNKHNLAEANLITLCHSCHSKTCNSANREHYIEYYSAMVSRRASGRAPRSHR